MNDSRSLLVFFTYGVSFERWDELGILDREVEIYRELREYFDQISFLSYGDERDESLLNDSSLSVNPIYSESAKPSNKYFKFFQSFFIPLFNGNFFSDHDIYKTNQMLGSWVPLIASKLHNRPLVIRCGYELLRNTLRSYRNNPTIFKTIRVIFYFLLEYLSYKCADRIFITSDSDRQFIVKTFGIDPEQIKRLPNFIDTDKFRPLPAEEVHNRKILTISRLHPRKNLDNLIKALENTDIGLDIIGQGEQQKNLQQLANRLKVSVQFKGTYDNDQIPGEINKYPLFVLPSKFENNPKALLEAMSCGTVVVGTEVPGISEIINSGQNGLLSKPDPKSLQQVITYAMTNYEEIKHLKHNARNTIVNKYSLKAVSEQETASYRDLINND